MKKLMTTVCCICLTTVLSAQTLTPAGRNELDNYLQQAVRETYIPGLVALVTSKDEVLYLAAFGKQDVSNDIPMDTASIFRIASMTKPVTSVAVMILVEQGKIALDDPVEKYLPALAQRKVFKNFNLENGTYEAVPAQTKMTIRHLLTHTSGLGYMFDSPILAYLIKDFSTSATGFPLLHEPGAGWTYGESTRVLGQVVETVTGMDLFEFMKKNILGPLQMQETFFDVPTELSNRMVTVHRSNGDVLVEDPNPAAVTSPHNGDGGLSSTAADYARFIRMFLNNGANVLDESTVLAMGSNQIGKATVELMPTTNPLLSRPFPLGAGVDRFGLGFQITQSRQPDMRAPGSMAWAGVYNTEFWIDPESGIGAVLLMQYLPFYDDKAIEVLLGFEQRLYQNLE